MEAEVAALRYGSVLVPGYHSRDHISVVTGGACGARGVDVEVMSV